MCTWNKKHDDFFGHGCSGRPVQLCSNEKDVKSKETTKKESPVDRLLESLRHLHV